MKAEPYFTDAEFKKKILAEWPILDYDRMDDERIRKVWMGPLVSVVIPTYKRKELLGRAVQSVGHASLWRDRKVRSIAVVRATIWHLRLGLRVALLRRPTP